MSAIDPQDPHTWPIDPASSKGPRIKDPADADQLRAEAEEWMEKLPPPPKPFGEQHIHDIEAWIFRVARSGGIPGLQWVYEPRNWPYSLDMRSRTQHTVGMWLRRLDDEAKAKRQAEAEERAEQLRNQDREARKAKGWL